jgi:hypothetical protein
MSTAQVAALVSRHLSGHQLPEPVSLHLSVRYVERPETRVQVDSTGLADTATVLLAWANTLTAVTLRAWRPASGATVHLDVHSALTGPAGVVALVIYGGVAFDPVVFPDLEPGQARPVSLGQLTGWAGQTGAGVAA